MAPPRYRLEMSRRALRDVRGLPAADRRRIGDALDRLAAGGRSLDVRSLHGAGSWRRLRAGDWRILFRPLSAEEEPTEVKAGRIPPGLLIARVVNRKDLERAVQTLD